MINRRYIAIRRRQLRRLQAIRIGQRGGLNEAGILLIDHCIEAIRGDLRDVGVVV